MTVACKEFAHAGKVEGSFFMAKFFPVTTKESYKLDLSKWALSLNQKDETSFLHMTGQGVHYASFYTILNLTIFC